MLKGIQVLRAQAVLAMSHGEQLMHMLGLLGTEAFAASGFIQRLGSTLRRFSTRPGCQIYSFRLSLELLGLTAEGSGLRDGLVLCRDQAFRLDCSGRVAKKRCKLWEV